MSHIRPVLFAAFCALAGLALAGAGGCGRQAAAVPPAAEAAVDVTIVRAGNAAPEALELPARVTARDEVTLTARLSARLTALPVREGGRFARGRILATFDAAETRALLEGAAASLASATVARDVARRQESRLDSLYASRVVASRDLEGAQSERRAADAGFAQAKAQLDQLRSAVELEAPFDGVVVRRHVDPGATVGPGQPVLDIRSAELGEIAASVPESELGRLAGGRVEVRIGEGPWLAARLVRVDGMTDFTTRSRVARFRPVTGAPLEAGAFARVRLHAGASTPAVDPADGAGRSVPLASLVRRGALVGVFVAEDGVARLRWLRVGREADGAIEVLAGLGPRDAVIAAPAGLADGRPVRVAS